MSAALAAAAAAGELGLPGVLATVAEVAGSTPREAGARMFVFAGADLADAPDAPELLREAPRVRDGDLRFVDTLGGGNLEALVLARAAEILADPSGGAGARLERFALGARTGQCCGGSVTVLIERLARPPEVLLFGAGHVGQALARALAGTRFRLRAVDERPEWLERMPARARRESAGWERAIAETRWAETPVFAVVMTHRHDLDQAIVEALLAREAPAAPAYVGLIGSRTKWERFRERLSARGVPADRLERVRCPIGLPGVGAKLPAEIAISIAAELLARAGELERGEPRGGA